MSISVVEAVVVEVVVVVVALLILVVTVDVICGIQYVTHKFVTKFMSLLKLWLANYVC